MDWQTPLALLCVALASLGVVRQLYRDLFTEQNSCSTGCSSCPSAKSPQQFVSLDALSINKMSMKEKPTNP